MLQLPRAAAASRSLRFASAYTHADPCVRRSLRLMTRAGRILDGGALGHVLVQGTWPARVWTLMAPRPSACSLPASLPLSPLSWLTHWHHRQSERRASGHATLRPTSSWLRAVVRQPCYHAGKSRCTCPAHARAGAQADMGRQTGVRLPSTRECLCGPAAATASVPHPAPGGDRGLCPDR